MVWQVADANSYVVITGGGIESIKIAKKAYVWPWQRSSRISISPFDFELSLQAMTIEKLQFCLPVVFTIGPDDEPASLLKFAKILTGRADEQSKRRAQETGRDHVQDIVKGIIEGETRVIVSQMTMEEIFKERQVFKTHVIENVQSELDQFGLRIYNANVKELQDAPGSEYFTFLSRKAHEGASNQAKIDVATATMMGSIGEAEKRGKTKQEISKIDAETAVLETKRKSEKATADAELTTTQTKLNMGINLANIQATREAEAKDIELQKVVELKRTEMKLEKLRATDLVSATIKKECAVEDAAAKLNSESRHADALQYRQKADAEGKLFAEKKYAEGALVKQQQDAEGRLFAEKKNAEGALVKQQQDAEGRLFAEKKNAEGALIKQQQSAEGAYYKAAKDADVRLYSEIKAAEATQRRADADYYARQREAEGLTAMAGAYSQLATVLGGPHGLLQYLMLERNTYEQLANANAKAIQGLQPKITVWNTGSDAAAGGADAAGAGAGLGVVKNIMQSLPPLLSTVHEQTGISPPGWLATMPTAEHGKELERYVEDVKGAGKGKGVKAGREK